TVYEDSKPGTLNDFLGAATEDDVCPEALYRFEKMVEEAARNAEAASQSAAAAKKSETAAASSRNAAKTSETNAGNSAKAAASSKTAAQNAATAAERSETNARASEEASADSEEASRRNAESAAENAGVATTKAREAAADATKAGQKKDEALSAATRAEKAADRAEAAAEVTAEPCANIVPPLPDVWIPFNDSLEMITGFAPGYKKVTIGDDVITFPSEKVVSFTRSTSATYINKSGSFTFAEINEPRFEKEGLLIEGQRTNTFTNSNNPSLWNYDDKNIEITTSVDEYGFKYGLFDVKETSTTERATIISTGYSRVIDVAANESVTLSCRVKKINGEGIITLRPRISFVNDDGTSNTLVAGSYIDCETGDVLGFSGGDAVNHVIYREANGWLRVEFTYKSPEAKSMYGRFEMGADKRAIKKGDQIMFTTPQFEKGSCASSFIVTSDVAVTRASDVVIMPIRLNWSTPPLSVLMEVNINWDKMPNSEGSARLLNVSITGATTDVADESYMYFGFTSGGARSIITNGKGTKTEYKAYCNRTTRRFIAGFKFTEQKELRAVINGNFGAVGVSQHTRQRYTEGPINIGGQSISGNRHLFGHVRNLRIWHKELTDAQMGERI
ncbi:prophage tail fiber N-terminal domain-containing protein, partial [Escherichia coli]|uniref:prophage tail fiber N-terminal domain-containing protein n=1 Tax=Escherichia coli TaxID=562 RepID=UPI00111B3D1F